MNQGIIRIWIGRWDFDPWRTTFYPNGLSTAKQLRYAAERLTSLEINANYYHSQKPATFAAWSKAVPDGFKFSVKTSRFTTNRKVLADGTESVERFHTQGIVELGERNGPSLWQFGTTKQFDPDDFVGFLATLPVALNDAQWRVAAARSRHTP